MTSSDTRQDPRSATRGLLDAVARELGGDLVGWRDLQSETTDTGFVRGYELELQLGDETRSRTVFLESTPPGDRRPGVLTLRRARGGDSLDAWLYPDDPSLPALARAVYPHRVERLLAGLGIDVSSPEISLVAYRPGKRAVVRLTWPAGEVFVKVVRPAKAGTLADRHRMFASSGIPVPEVLGWSEEGFVALAPVLGTEARLTLEQLDDPDRFLDSVEELVQRFRAVPAIYSVRASLLDDVEWYFGRLLSAQPELAPALDELRNLIDARAVRGRDFPLTPTTIHGDLHLGQLFVDPDEPWRITGLLDVDTAGAGDPADDAAALYAHLQASAIAASSSRPQYSAVCLDLAARWLARWAGHSNPGFDDRARAIAATHLLGHAMRYATDDTSAAVTALLDRARAVVLPD